MKIALAADHGGYVDKEKLKKTLESQGHAVKDFGTWSPEDCDYPEFAYKASTEVSLGRADRAVLLCRSGMGMCMVANKVKGVRAALCHDLRSVRLSREHNDANVLVLGSEDLDDDMEAIVAHWLKTPFEGGRHKRRVDQIHSLEKVIR